MKHRMITTKLLVGALLVAIVVTLACVVATANTAFDAIYFESFEDLKEGASSYGSGSDGEYRLLTDEHHNRYFSMLCTGEDTAATFTLPSAAANLFCISLDILKNDLKSTVSLFSVNAIKSETLLATLNPDGTMTVGNNAQTVTLSTPGGAYHLRFLINTADKTMSVLVDGKTVASVTGIKIKNMRYVRLKQSGSTSAELQLDNLIVYNGKSINGTEDLTPFHSQYNVGVRSQMLATGTVAMYLNKSNVLLYGDKNYIDNNRDIVPYREGDIYYLPVSFFAESLGGSCTTESTGKATLTIAGKTETIDTVIGPGNAAYADARKLCNTFNMYLHCEENGLLFYGAKPIDSLIDWKNNLAFTRDVFLGFIYDDIVGSELTSLVKKNYPGQGHPRLIMTPEKIEQLQAALADPNCDPVYKKTFESLSYYANRYLASAPSEYEIRDGIRLLYVCNENEDRILVLAMMYLLTENEEYAEAAYETMKVCAEFKDWNPYHFLDVGTLAGALGLGYDWLYNWMDEGQRELIRTAIIEKGFYPYMDDLNDAPRSRSWNWRNGTGDNWCMIIAGECVAGLAICDELEGYDLECAERAMQYSLIDMGHSLRLFAPYGAYEEGPGYWSYGMNYCVQALQSLITATGKDYGYVDAPGVNMTNRYLMTINGSVMQFTYHDSGVNSVNYPPQTMFLASYFNNYGEGTLRMNQILKGGVASSSALYTVADMYLYDPAFATATLDRSELNTYLPISELAVFRTGFESKDTYVGLHCDDPKGGDSHDHMDAGHFALQCRGQNFFFDLGADNYNISNYHGCYRMRAEGHNTVVFNPDSNWDQKYGGTASIVEFFSGAAGGYAIGNLSDAYYESTGVTSFRRGLMLDASQEVVILQDEIRTEKSVDMWWFAHTKARIDIDESKTRAVLTLGGQKLVAEIQSGEGATFEVMNAEPLPTSPVVPDQATNPDVRKLVIHIPECRDIDLVVTFVPYGVDNNGYDYEFASLDEWKNAMPPEDATTEPSDTTETPSTTEPSNTTNDENTSLGSKETTTDTIETTPSPTESSSAGIVIAIVAAVVVIGVLAVLIVKKRSGKK